MGKVQFSEYLGKVDVFKQVECNELYPTVLKELTKNLKAIKIYLWELIKDNGETGRQIEGNRNAYL